ncbi:MAG TPA: hypothetical protein VE842_00525 [Pyrinomonadaceae bacterium]|nr:hypothetical protein [Pyrinomonadaceae bacterium]
MSKEKYQSVRRIEEIASIIFFVAALYLPLLGMAFDINLTPAHKENRRLAAMPRLSLKRSAIGSFPEEFRAYFQDHFGFRNELIGWQATAKVKWLGVSSSKEVILGKDGWLFQPPYDNSLEKYRGPRPFTGEQLAQWQRVLESRRNWLAERRVPFLFVVAPEKHSVYPEYVPDAIRRMRQTSRLDQLIAYLKEHSDIKVIDLRPALYEAKGRERLYHRLDSHWNDYGAFVAYQRIVRELSVFIPGMQPLAESEFEIVREQSRGMDLASLLGLGNVLAEENLRLRPRRLSLVVQGDVHNSVVPLVSERKGTSLPRLVMFRDSYANNLIPLLSEHFSRAVYIWKGFDPRVIEAERPDVVIQEIVERGLLRDPTLEGPLVD